MSNIKYYTKITPEPLWFKLLDKGMPAEYTAYAQVFDWLLEKGICVNIHPDKYSHKSADMWRYTCYDFSAGKPTISIVG